MAEAAETMEATETASTETTETTASEETTTETTTEETASEETTDETTETEATEEGEGTEATEETAEDTSTKALKDTKAWATKLSQDNASLKRQMAALEQTPQIVTPALAKELEQFPAMAKEIGETYGEEVGQMFTGMSNVITQLASGVAQFESFSGQAKFTAEMGAKHPDFQEVYSSDEFGTWLEAQPPFFQAGALSDNAEDAAPVLDLFKKSTAGAKQVEARQKMREANDAKQKATKAPNTGSGPPKTETTFKRSQLKDKAFYRKNRDAILDAASKGKIIEG